MSMPPHLMAMFRSIAIQALLVAALGLPQKAIAQESFGLQPFGECRTGYWSSTRNLDAVEDVSSSTCFINLKLQPTENIRLAASARLSQAMASSGSNFRGRLREAYAQADAGNISFKLGRQIVVWGRSDRISPTDVMSSRDFTARLPDDDEQRSGNDLATIRWQFAQDVAATFHLGHFEANVVPTGALPANLIAIAAPRRAEFALKLDRAGEGVDFSLSYFDGFDKAARYSFVQSGLLGNFQSQYERMQMAGFDFATSSGRWTFRGEMAAFRLVPECVQCASEALLSRKVQRVVGGLDRDFFDTANINVQLFAVKRSNYESPAGLQGAQRLIADGLNRLNGEFAAIERGLTLRVSERFLNEQLKIEASGIFDLTNASGLLRTRINYAVNDQVKLYAGFDSFRGKDQSLFGSRRKNNAAFVELAVVF